MFSESESDYLAGGFINQSMQFHFNLQPLLHLFLEVGQPGPSATSHSWAEQIRLQSKEQGHWPSGLSQGKMACEISGRPGEGAY